MLAAYVTIHFYFVHRSIMAIQQSQFDQLGVQGWQPHSKWWAMPGIVTAFSIPYIVAAWLLFVLTLFLAVDPRRKFWCWPVTILVF